MRTVFFMVVSPKNLLDIPQKSDYHLYHNIKKSTLFILVKGSFIVSFREFRFSSGHYRNFAAAAASVGFPGI